LRIITDLKTGQDRKGSAMPVIPAGLKPESYQKIDVRLCAADIFSSFHKNDTPYTGVVKMIHDA